MLDVYNSIPGVITDQSSSVVDDVKAALVTTKDQLQDVSEEFADIINEVRAGMKITRNYVNYYKPGQSRQNF